MCIEKIKTHWTPITRDYQCFWSMGLKDSMGIKDSVYGGTHGISVLVSVKQFDLVFSKLIVTLPVCRTWGVPGSGPWRDQLPCALGESNRQWAPEGRDGEPDLRHPRGHHARQWHSGPNLLPEWPWGHWAPQAQSLLLLWSGGRGPRQKLGFPDLSLHGETPPCLDAEGGASIRRDAHGPESRKHVHEVLGSGRVAAGGVLTCPLF